MAANNELFPRIDKLNKSNYELWKFNMTNYISSQNWTRVIDGTVPADHADFPLLDAKARTAIGMTLDAEHLSMVIHCATSKDMWDTIKRIKEQSSDTNRMLAQYEFMDYKIRSGQSLSEYFSGLNLIVAKLRSLGKEVEDVDIISKALHDLPKEYDNFKTNWRMIAVENEEMMKTEKFYSHILSAEASMKKEKPTEVKSEAFLSKRPQQQKKELECFNCGKKGHFKRDCRSKPKDSQSTHDRAGSSGRQQKSSNKNKQADETKHKGFMARDDDASSREWIADSGASLHMTSDRSLFRTYTRLNQSCNITMANDVKIQAVGVGDIHVRAHNGKEWVTTVLRDVHHLPELGKSNLFSLGHVTDRYGYTVLQSASKIFINDGSKCCLTGYRNEGDLWILNLQSVTHQANTAKAQGIRVWHERLGHTGHQKLMHMKRHDAAAGYDVSDTAEFDCTGCALGRMVKLPSVDTPSRACKPGERFSVDLCGKMKTHSIGGALYFMIMKDESTCFRSVYFLKTKEEEEVLQWIKVHFARSERETGMKVKSLRSDNGKEFVNSGITAFLNKEGIVHETTVTHSPQMNGMLERDNRTIQEMARSMLHAAHLPSSLWAEMVNTAVYLQNRVPNRKEKESPFSLWYGHRPYVGHLRVIGSDAFVHIPKALRAKFDQTSWKGIHVGYGRSNKFYRIYDPENQRVEIKKDVRIHEKKCAEAETVLPVSSDTFVESDDDDDEDRKEQEKKEAEAKRKPGRPAGAKNKTKEPHTPHHMHLRNRNKHDADEAVQEKQKSPAKSDDDPFVDADDHLSDDDHVSAHDTAFMQDEDDDEKDAMNDLFAFLTHCEDKIPASYKEAMQSPESEKWKQAMSREMQSLIHNKTWKLSQLPAGRVTVKNRWVFAIKRDRKGHIMKHKARLVAKGFTQKKGIDFKDTFSPVVRHESLRILLAIAAHRRLTLTQFDVTTAFLHGVITEDLYMEQPEGFSDGSPKVCKLLKGIYGLKQSPRVWNENVDQTLKKMGMKQLQSDSCVYTDSHSPPHIFISLFVDDGLILSETEKQASDIIAKLRKVYDVTVTSGQRYIGLEIDQTVAGDIVISQTAYITEVLTRFNMNECRAIKTPADCTVSLSKDMSPAKKDEDEMKSVPYMEVVGSLMYASTVTRPDISFATGKVAQFFSNPGPDHWKAAKRILRYLQGTRDMSIMYSKGENDDMVLEAFADSDHAGETDSRKSTSGVVLTLNGSPVSWFSRLQKCVSLSTTQSEHVSMAEATKEIMWTRDLLTECGEKQELPTVLYNDNTSALKLTTSKEFHSRTKHILTKVHFVKDEVKRGTIATAHLSSTEMPADVLTKPLTAAAHVSCLEQMKLQPKSQRGLKLKALLMCLLVLHDATLARGMFDPHPPLIWRKSKSPLVNGAQVIQIDAKMMSPCAVYQSLNLSSVAHVNKLSEWCERSYDMNVMQKLKKMDAPPHTSLRAKRFPGLAAIAAALAAVPGLGWVALVVVAVVVAGVVAYNVMSSRVSSAENEIKDLDSRFHVLKENQEKIKLFAEKAQEDIQQLAAKHNLLSSSFAHLQMILPKMISFTADISSRLAITGEQIEDGIRMWREAKISDQLLRALNITLPCDKRCPVKLMEPISWRREGNLISLVIIAPLLNLEKDVIEADAFALLSRSGGETCFWKYSGPRFLSVSKADGDKCSLSEVNNVYHDLMASTGKVSCNISSDSAWQKTNCTTTPHFSPQCKRQHMNNIVYCPGMKIRIDGNEPQDCPDVVFSLSVQQSFSVGDYRFTGIKTVIHTQQDLSPIIQSKINNDLLPGFNPYQVHVTSGNVSLSWAKEGEKTDNTFLWITISLLILLIILLSVQAYVWYKDYEAKAAAAPKKEKKERVQIELKIADKDRPIEELLNKR